MKTSIIRIAMVVAAAFFMPSTMNAQFADLLNKAKSLFGGSSSTTSTITNVVGNLLGNTKITAQKLEGTWSYTQPCIAFESESTLNNIGGSVASAKIEEKLKTGLDKAGIKEGQMSITFNADKTFYISTGNRQISGTYEVEGSDLLLTFKTTKKTIKTNVKLSLGTCRQDASDCQHHRNQSKCLFKQHENCFHASQPIQKHVFRTKIREEIASTTPFNALSLKSFLHF